MQLLIGVDATVAYVSDWRLTAHMSYIDYWISRTTRNVVCIKYYDSMRVDQG